MIRIGIIGFGKMGKIRAQYCAESGRADVTSLYDPAPPALGEPAMRASSPEALLADPRIDAVFICTPNFQNKPLTIAALRAGKHVFCEKPPAFTAADVEEIRRVEAQCGKVLMYGFNHRHHESVQRMKQIVDGGEMGRVLWMRGRYGKEVNEAFFNGWRAKKELSGGGILLDQGIHMLDLFLYLGGGFDEVQAMVSNLYWKIDGIEDNVFANFRSSRTGICASLHSTMTQWRYLFSLEIFLERGALVLNGLKTSSGAYGAEDLSIKRNRNPSARGAFDTEERLTYHADTSWASEVAHFLDAVTLGRAPTIGHSADALEVMKLIDQVYTCR
jgi:1,5-anhydro-D-fructose reductase (1,5-anhydro-D-mannitol-forming)